MSPVAQPSRPPPANRVKIVRPKQLQPACRDIPPACQSSARTSALTEEATRKLRKLPPACHDIMSACQDIPPACQNSAQTSAQTEEAAGKLRKPAAADTPRDSSPAAEAARQLSVKPTLREGRPGAAEAAEKVKMLLLPPADYDCCLFWPVCSICSIIVGNLILSSAFCLLQKRTPSFSYGYRFCVH